MVKRIKNSVDLFDISEWGDHDNYFTKNNAWLPENAPVKKVRDKINTKFNDINGLIGKNLDSSGITHFEYIVSRVYEDRDNPDLIKDAKIILTELVKFGIYTMEQCGVAIDPWIFPDYYGAVFTQYKKGDEFSANYAYRVSFGYALLWYLLKHMDKQTYNPHTMVVLSMKNLYFSTIVGTTLPINSFSDCSRHIIDYFFDRLPTGETNTMPAINDSTRFLRGLAYAQLEPDFRIKHYEIYKSLENSDVAAFKNALKV